MNDVCSFPSQTSGGDTSRKLREFAAKIGVSVEEVPTTLDQCALLLKPADLALLRQEIGVDVPSVPRADLAKKYELTYMKISQRMASAIGVICDDRAEREEEKKPVLMRRLDLFFSHRRANEKNVTLKNLTRIKTWAQGLYNPDSPGTPITVGAFLSRHRRQALPKGYRYGMGEKTLACVVRMLESEGLSLR